MKSYTTILARKSDVIPVFRSNRMIPFVVLISVMTVMVQGSYAGNRNERTILGERNRNILGSIQELEQRISKLEQRVKNLEKQLSKLKDGSDSHEQTWKWRREFNRVPLTSGGDFLSYPDDKPYTQPRGHRVLYDEARDIYRMWISWHWKKNNQQASEVWYYESEDGVNWSEPEKTDLSYGGRYRHLWVTKVLDIRGELRMWTRNYWTSTACSGWGGWTNEYRSEDGLNWTDHGKLVDERDYGLVVPVSENVFWHYTSRSGDSSCDSHWMYRLGSDDGEDWGGEKHVTYDGDRMLAARGYKNYVNREPHVQRNFTIRSSPDNKTIELYGLQYHQDRTYSLVKMESPVHDGVDFRNETILIDNVHTDRFGNTDYLEGMLRPRENPDEPCFIFWNQDKQRSFMMCSDEET